MIIGVDLDGVTVDFQNTWADLYSHYYDKYIPLEALNKYNALLDETHFSDMPSFYAWFRKANGWRKLPYLVGAQGGIDALVAAGHEIKFITARPSEAETPTWDWLQDSPWWTVSSVSLVRVDWKGPNKHLVEADIYIDDTPKVLESLVAHDKKVIVFDQPWNQEFVGPRAHGWTEVVAMIATFDAAIKEVASA